MDRDEPGKLPLSATFLAYESMIALICHQFRGHLCLLTIVDAMHVQDILIGNVEGSLKSIHNLLCLKGLKA